MIGCYSHSQPHHRTWFWCYLLSVDFQRNKRRKHGDNHSQGPQAIQPRTAHLPSLTELSNHTAKEDSTSSITHRVDKPYSQGGQHIFYHSQNCQSIQPRWTAHLPPLPEPSSYTANEDSISSFTHRAIQPRRTAHLPSLQSHQAIQPRRTGHLPPLPEPSSHTANEDSTSSFTHRAIKPYSQGGQHIFFHSLSHQAIHPRRTAHLQSLKELSNNTAKEDNTSSITHRAVKPYSQGGQPIFHHSQSCQAIQPRRTAHLPSLIELSSYTAKEDNTSSFTHRAIKLYSQGGQHIFLHY